MPCHREHTFNIWATAIARFFSSSVTFSSFDNFSCRVVAKSRSAILKRNIRCKWPLHLGIKCYLASSLQKYLTVSVPLRLAEVQSIKNGQTGRAVADPEFLKGSARPRGRSANLLFDNVCRKLHENERNGTKKGERVLRSATAEVICTTMAPSHQMQ